VAVGVDRAEGIIEALGEVGAATLLAPPPVDELVVFRAEVGMVRVDQLVQVGGVLDLELGHGLGLLLRALLLPQGGHVLAHLLEHLDVLEGVQLLEAAHLALLFTGYVFEQQATGHDLGYCLVEGDRLPLVFTPFAGSFQHPGDAVGVVGALVAGLPLGTDGAVQFGGPLDIFLHVQVRVEGEGVVGAAVYLDRHAVHDLDLDAAAGVAVEADGVKGVFGLHQLVGLELGQFTRFYPGDEAVGEVQLGGHQGAAADHGGGFEKIAAGYAVVHIICHRAPPAFHLQYSTPAAQFLCQP